MTDKFPKAYVNAVRKDPMMEYVPFENLDIGARKSGLPKEGKKGNLGIDHVGGGVSPPLDVIELDRVGGPPV